MKVLIVGSTSALAAATCPLLGGFSEVLRAGRRGGDVAFDLADPPERIRIPHGVDAVVHMAAHFGGKTPEDMRAAESLNVLGTLGLCQAASAAGVRHFVLISSVFAELRPGDFQYGIYSVSKRHAEEVASLWCSANAMPLAIIRPSRIYGDDDSFRKHQPLIYAFADHAQSGAGISIDGTHDARRNFIHVEDVAAGISSVVKARLTGVMTAASPVDATMSEIARAALQAFRSPGEVSFVAGKPDVRDSVATPDNRLWESIGFPPRIGIAEGMRRIAIRRGVA
jgi:nucleoside-diphosphate-sugar epimerase